MLNYEPTLSLHPPPRAIPAVVVRAHYALPGGLVIVVVVHQRCHRLPPPPSPPSSPSRGWLLLGAACRHRHPHLSWKCRFFRCRPQLVLKTYLRVFPTRRPDTAVVSATSCDVGFFFSVSYVVSLPNCRHVVVRST